MSLAYTSATALVTSRLMARRKTAQATPERDTGSSLAFVLNPVALDGKVGQWGTV